MSTPALIDTSSGEVLDLGTLDVARWAPDELAALRDRLADLERLIAAAKAEIDVELAAELDRANVGSGRFGDFEVSVPAAFETVWDISRLGVALEALVQAGKITRAAAAAALEAQPVEYKPRAAKLKKLLGHPDPDVVDAIEACRRAEPRRRRYATVKRAASPLRALRGAHEPVEGTQ